MNEIEVDEIEFERKETKPAEIKPAQPKSRPDEDELVIRGQRHLRKRIESHCDRCKRLETDRNRIRLRLAPDGTTLCGQCNWNKGHLHGTGPTTPMQFNVDEINAAWRAMRAEQITWTWI